MRLPIVNFVLLFLLAGCSTMLPSTGGSTPKTTVTSPENPTQAKLTFELEVPASTPSETKIYIDILDEVTGLALNPTRYQLESRDPTHFFVNLPVALGTVLKYRYLREGTPPYIEYNSQGKQVRYRLYYVTNPAVVKDTISAWIDQAFRGQSGRVQGRVTNGFSGAPLPNILVAISGQYTFTSSDGYFLLEGLPVGTHHLVAYSIDGSFLPFQQGATIGAGSTTPASFSLKPAGYVQVTFNTRPPAEGIAGAPIRLLGNIYPLGNTFADLSGGVSVVASRAPYMVRKPDGTYTLTLKLPAGLDLRYKYSLGDGFWNAEHTNSGSFRARQIIIPSQDITIEDTIETWKTGNMASLTFNTRTPANTPPQDMVSIQFNPYSWMEPIPMWSLGNNQWLYVLYSPLDIMKNLNYRYCRNDQCSRADDEATRGQNVQGRPITISSMPQTFTDEVTKWAWWQPATVPTTIVAQGINSRGPGFITGVEFEAEYQPSSQSYISHAFLTSQQIGAKWVILSPTWTYSRNNLPMLEAVPGKDPLWTDMLQQISWSQQKNLNAALFPQTNFDIAPDQWWTNAHRNANWWQSWFDRYRTFLINYADMAAQTNASALILGESGGLPALPEGKIPKTGQPSNAPFDSDNLWRQIISEIRKHYSGKLVWAIQYPGGFSSYPSFIYDMDMVYVLWSTPLSKNTLPSQSELRSQIGKQLDENILPFKEKIKKTIIVGIDYPSIENTAAGCVTIDNSCQPFDILRPNKPDIRTAVISQQAQVDIYNAFLTTLNSKPYVEGFVSRGFYPVAALQDKSSSIHGKPATDVLWYWFPRLTGATK